MLASVSRRRRRGRGRRSVPAEAALADRFRRIALLGEAIDAGRLSLPFPMSTGCRTSHAFQVRFRAETLQRPQLRRFRQWLLDEGAVTRQWVESRTDAAQ